MEHVLDTLQQKYEERRYCAYVTDALMVIANNVAHTLGGSALSVRWVDAYKQKDTRTGDEIALEVITKCGLKLKGDEADGRIRTESSPVIG